MNDFLSEGGAAWDLTRTTVKLHDEEGYDVTFLSNAIGSESVPSYEAAVHLSYPMIGNAVLEVEDFLAAVEASGATRTSIQVGDTVRGSDHLEIGTVERWCGRVRRRKRTCSCPGDLSLRRIPISRWTRW